MKVIPALIGSLLIFEWTLAPAQAVEATRDRGGAKTGSKAKAGAKVKVKVKAKPKVKSKATLPGTAAPTDERSLEAEVAAVKKILSANPRDSGARDRLARAAVVLIDMLLGAEAVGDTAKAERLARMLTRDMPDTGLRVHALSQKGDLRASQATGFLFAHGIFLRKDANKACGEFVVAAEKLPSAGWHAAQCLMEALPEQAWENMERAAQRGHATAQEWMGRRCLGEFGAKEKDFVCARNYLIQSASQGRPRAQTLLAYLLATGKGGPADASRAIRLYTVAAEQGDVNAQTNLGEIYEMGRGVAANPDEAIRWYERAAAKGLGAAQFNAGRLWAIGVGEKKDPEKARAFLVQAEGNGVAQARQMLDWLDRKRAPEPGDTPASKPATALDSNGVKD